MAAPTQERTVQDAVEHTLMPSEVTARDDAAPGKVRCIVVTPEKAVLDELADMVVIPLFDGEFGVLPGRAPVIGRLGAGELRLKTGTAVKRYFIDAGFVHVRANVVTILTAKASPAADVTAAAAEQAVAEANAMPFGTAVERANKSRARDRAQGMKKVASRNAGGATSGH